MTLDEIEDALPWGFHDAYLEQLEIDWSSGRAVLGLRLMMSEHQDMDQRAKVIVEGLHYCSVPPLVQPDAGGLWLDTGAETKTLSGHPPVPAGHFLHYFFVRESNQFIHICGRDARLEWIESAPVPARSGMRALFPGDTIPDPE